MLRWTSWVKQVAANKQSLPGLHKESSDVVRAVISSNFEILPMLNTLASNDMTLTSTSAIAVMGTLQHLTREEVKVPQPGLTRYADSLSIYIVSMFIECKSLCNLFAQRHPMLSEHHTLRANSFRQISEINASDKN